MKRKVILIASCLFLAGCAGQAVPSVDPISLEMATVSANPAPTDFNVTNYYVPMGLVSWTPIEGVYVYQVQLSSDQVNWETTNEGKSLAIPNLTSSTVPVDIKADRAYFRMRTIEDQVTVSQWSDVKSIVTAGGVPAQCLDAMKRAAGDTTGESQFQEASSVCQSAENLAAVLLMVPDAGIASSPEHVDLDLMLNTICQSYPEGAACKDYRTNGLSNDR